MDNKLKKLLSEIDKNVMHFPDILQHVASKMRDYEKTCKKQNDHLLREALGDALTFLSLDEKPSTEIITKCSSRINKAIFSDGITNYHHNGEKDYFNKYINKKEGKE